MYIYIYNYVYICIYMHVHICISSYIHIYIYTGIHIYIYTYIHICIYWCRNPAEVSDDLTLRRPALACTSMHLCMFFLQRGALKVVASQRDSHLFSSFIISLCTYILMYTCLYYVYVTSAHLYTSYIPDTYIPIR